MALLFRRDRASYLGLVAGAEHDRSSVLRLEQDQLGVTHPEAGAAALEAWRFPPAFVRAVADHHHPPERVGNSLGRIIVAGQAVAGLLGALPSHVPPTDVESAFDALGLPAEQSRPIALAARREIEELGRALGIRS